MRKNIVLFLLFTGITISQSVIEIDDFTLSPVSDFYSNNYLYGSNTGKGNTGVGSINNFDAVLLNPAALSLDKNISAFAQYSYKTNRTVNYSFESMDYKYELKPKPLSFSAGVSFKINKYLNAGVLYNNNNTAEYDFNPESNSEYKLGYNLNVHSLSLPVNIHFKMFSFGVNLYYSLYSNKLSGVTTITEPNTPHDVTQSFERLNVQAGLYFNPSQNFSAGLTFTPGFTSDIKSSEDLGNPVFIKFISRNPFKISAGVCFKTLNKRLSLLLDYNFRRTSEMKGYLDKNDFNFGAEYSVNKNLIARGGFFTLFDIRDFHHESISFPGSEGDFTQYFLTAGLTYKHKNIDISLSLMDSHISPGKIKLIYANSTLTFNF